MNFIINKITYILERPLLMVTALVMVFGLQVVYLTKEVQNLKSQINISQEVGLPTMVMPPKQNSIPELSQEVHIPNMPTKLPTEEK